MAADIAWWAEQQFMRPTALYVSGINADHMPEGLHADRAKLHGLPLPSIEAARKAAFRNLQLCATRWIADMLADGGPICWAASPASPTSRPITSSGSSAAATSIAARC